MCLGVISYFFVFSFGYPSFVLSYFLTWPHVSLAMYNCKMGIINMQLLPG